MKSESSESNSSSKYFDTSNLRSDLKGRAVRGAGASAFSNTSYYCIQILSTIVLARLLTPDDFGLVAMALTIHSFLQIIRGFGLLDATVQREEINHKLISTIFWINVAFGLTLTLVFMALAPLVAWFYKEPQLNTIVIFISLDYIFGGLCTQHRALLSRSLHMYRWGAINIAAAIISFGTAIIMALHGWGYWALVARWVIFSISQAIFSWILCSWRPGLPSSVAGIRSMLKFGINLIGNFTVEYFAANIEKILIGRRLGAKSLGYYHKAYHLFAAPAGQISAPLVGVAISTLSRLCNDPKKYNRYYLNALSMLGFVGLPIGAILALTGKDIIYLILGPQWGKAGEIFAILGPAIGMQMLYDSFSWVHTSLGRTDRRLRWGIIASIVTTVSYVIGLSFGVLGVAAAKVISLHILIGPALWYAGKPIGLRLRYIVSAIWKYYLSALCAGLFCWYFLYSFNVTSNIFTTLNILIRLLLSSTLCTCLYVIMTIALYRSPKPITQFISIVREMIPITIKKKNKN